ncbi:hypothetical protein D9M73_140400 [compost metagenome]|uniref:Uncharacterized protein n=1 Tax=Polaromonas aquatica TaxID=332657 RepID=A0ABW1TWE8_9BURK
MHKSAIALALVLAATAASAFPTKVKMTKDADLASSEGVYVQVTTNKGRVTVNNKWPAYRVLSRAKKGECYILETDSESTVDFNMKPDESGVSTVTKTRC